MINLNEKKQEEKTYKVQNPSHGPAADECHGRCPRIFQSQMLNLTLESWEGETYFDLGDN